ncbi:putative MFS family arabinose efflux permease [Saccharothrix saharensis]|uniref:Putative MFS family arabinose efflux permease n=1 Tax=Saccharothrix saharensis TaxID=571190 RepID=A0A543JPX3_9PSEU|nr:MFS transporter [Saccharothrix saharensis]TQM84824.1 putative MFS family arabinose efflux permease [Saccharothrix saharensis]
MLRRNRSFLLLWAGQAVSLVGSQVTAVAVPLVAALTLGAGAFEVGVVAACGRVPYLVFGLPAGVWVDRLPRRVVAAVCAVGQAVCLAVVPVAAGLGALTVASLAAVAAVAGTFAVFGDVAGLALVPMVVPAEQRTRAQGAVEVGQATAQVAGPALGGWLVGVVTAAGALVVDAVSFLVAAVTLLWVRVVERPQAGAGVGDGVRAVFGHQGLRRVTLCTATQVFWFNAFTVVVLLHLVSALGLSAARAGLTLSVGAVGGLLGALVAARSGERWGRRRTMVVAVLVTGVGQALVAVDVLVVGAVAVMWFALQVYNVHQVPVRYEATPAALHGRVNATIRTAVWGTAPAGALVGGLLGDAVGLRATLVLSGLGAATACLWLLRARVD